MRKKQYSKHKAMGYWQIIVLIIFLLPAIMYAVSKDGTVFKLSAATGVSEWHYSSDWLYDDVGYDIIYGTDGNTYMAGYAYGEGGGNLKDFFVLSLDPLGNERWVFIADGPDHADDEAYSICYGGDYVYPVGYYTDGGNKAITVFKISAATSVSEWRYSSDWLYDDVGYDIIYGTDGNTYMAGYAYGEGGGNLKDFVALSLDPSGNERWVSISDGPAHADDEAYSICYGGGYVYAAGYQTTNTPAVDITLTPYNPPIMIPPGGGSFDYNIAITNNEIASLNCNVWCMVTLPNGALYGPVLGPASITLPGGFAANRDRTQAVPGNARSGTYTYRGYVGIYPYVIWDVDSFFFQKLGTDQRSVIKNWHNTGESFGE